MSDYFMKPCPFCGCHVLWSAFVVNQGIQWGRIVCPECEAWGPEVRTSYDTGPDDLLHLEAIKEWNKRGEP